MDLRRRISCFVSICAHKFVSVLVGHATYSNICIYSHYIGVFNWINVSQFFQMVLLVVTVILFIVRLEWSWTSILLFQSVFVRVYLCLFLFLQQFLCVVSGIFATFPFDTKYTNFYIGFGTTKLSYVFDKRPALS